MGRNVSGSRHNGIPQQTRPSQAPGARAEGGASSVGRKQRARVCVPLRAAPAERARTGRLRRPARASRRWRPRQRRGRRPAVPARAPRAPPCAPAARRLPPRRSRRRAAAARRLPGRQAPRRTQTPAGGPPRRPRRRAGRRTRTGTRARAPSHPQCHRRGANRCTPTEGVSAGAPRDPHAPSAPEAQRTPSETDACSRTERRRRATRRGVGGWARCARLQHSCHLGRGAARCNAQRTPQPAPRQWIQPDVRTRATGQQREQHARAFSCVRLRLHAAATT